MPFVPVFERQVLTPGNLDFSSAQEAAANVGRQGQKIGAAVSDVAGQVADRQNEQAKIAERVNEIDYTSKATTDATLSVNQSYLDGQAQFSDDPSKLAPKLQTDIDAAYDEKINNAPTPNARAVLQADKQRFKTSMVTKAQDWSHQQTVKNAADGIDQQTDQLLNGMQNTPTDDQWHTLVDQGRAVIEASPVLTRSEKDKKATGFVEAATFNRVRENIEANPGVALQQLHHGDFDEGISPKNKSTLIMYAENKQQQLQERAIAQAEKFNRLRQDDPAAFIYATNPGIKGPQDAVALQMQNIDQEMNRRAQAQEDAGQPLTPSSLQAMRTDALARVTILPKQVAAQWIDDFKSAQSYEGFVQKRRQFIEEVGGMDNYNIGVRDLQKNHLPDSLNMLLRIDPATDPIVGADLYSVMRADPKEIKAAADQRRLVTNDKPSDLERSVVNASSEYFDLQMRGGMETDKANMLRSRVMDLANYYYSQGDDIGKSTTKATDWLLSRQRTESVNGSKILVPLTMSTNNAQVEIPGGGYKGVTVEDVLDTHQNAVLKGDIQTPSGWHAYSGLSGKVQVDQTYAETVQQHGEWRNQGSDNVSLFDGAGNQVKYKNGMPVVLNWRQVGESMHALGDKREAGVKKSKQEFDNVAPLLMP